MTNNVTPAAASLFAKATTAMASRRMRDGDGDGVIFDGTPYEQPAPQILQPEEDTRRRVTETPQFRRWFGGSKVVDENGEPLIVYHGTPQVFTEFSERHDSGINHVGRGMYFAANPAVANEYAKRGEQSNVMPVYLSIKRPLDLSTPITQADIDSISEYYASGVADQRLDQHIVDLFERLDAEVPKEDERRAKVQRAKETIARDLRFLAEDGATWAVAHRDILRWDKGFNDYLQLLGYDGIRHLAYDSFGSVETRNVRTTDHGEVWIAFNPRQVKSATGNNGDFSATSADVTKAIGKGTQFVKDASIVRDGDGDGRIFDGTPQEQPYVPQAEPEDEQQQASRRRVTESPEFRQWFGQSRVVDETGQPQILYHATFSDFNQFHNPGAESGISMFTTDPEYSNLHISGGGAGARSIPVYLRAERPLDLRSIPSRRSDARAKLRNILLDATEEGTAEQQAAVEEMIPLIQSERDIYQIVNRSFRSKQMKQLLHRAGFDSIVMNDHRQGISDDTGQMKEVEAQTWVIFDPNQVKSAIGNNGRFSRESYDITKAVSAMALFTRAARAGK